MLRSVLMFLCFFFLVSVPTTPVNVQVDVLSSTSVNVTWEAPAVTRGNIEHYILFYSEPGTPEDEVQSAQVRVIDRPLFVRMRYTQRSVKAARQTPNVPSLMKYYQVTMSDCCVDVV